MWSDNLAILVIRSKKTYIHFSSFYDIGRNKYNFSQNESEIFIRLKSWKSSKLPQFLGRAVLELLGSTNSG